MKHFEISVWCDFARGLMQGRRRAMLQSHLESCKECVDMATKLGYVFSSASEDRKYPVPVPLVQTAKLIYNLADFDLSIMRWGRRVLARLVFDGFGGAAPVGVRSTRVSDRHSVYRAGQVSVDLRLEHLRESAEVIVIGQITNPKAPWQVLPAQKVFLISGNKLVDRTRSNSLGEFQVRSKVDPKVRLILPFEDASRWIDISLNKLIEMPVKLFSEESSKGKTAAQRRKSHKRAALKPQKKQ